MIMRREIRPELYNYNKFPGPEFVTFDDIVKTDAVTLKLVENYRGGFQLEAFNQRFSDILLKYDYIVGDWGHEQLRLKGFYRDGRRKEVRSHLSRLEDYLREYCNYGCAYFILANDDPKESKFFEKKTQRRKRQYKPKYRSQELRGKKENQKEREAQQEIQEAKRGFVIRQKNR